MTHDDRIRAIRSAFADANASLANRIEAIDDGKVAAPAADGWNPAQICWHVAVTNEFLAGALSGAVPGMSVSKPEGFTETLATLEFPEKIKTYPQLEPPAHATRAEALSRLRASVDAFGQAVGTVTPDRAASSAVQMPFGVFSLYEVGEFAAAHVRRHIGQVKRTAGQA